jgi:EAL domain-containing protein (putative c-di-GMP-specific phosphodiesterase class I)
MDVVPFLEEMVRKYNIDKHFIHVEITESALTENAELLAKNIHDLKEKGYALWLDDFGSGYSSLNVLKDYDFDVLKLDMAFLIGFNGNEKAKALIKSVISLAEQIGMKTLCEGVETAEQAAFLEEASCGRLQGYLYGKPLSYEELMKKIDEGEYNLAKKMID